MWDSLFGSTLTPLQARYPTGNVNGRWEKTRKVRGTIYTRGGAVVSTRLRVLLHSTSTVVLLLASEGISTCMTASHWCSISRIRLLDCCTAVVACEITNFLGGKEQGGLPCARVPVQPRSKSSRTQVCTMRRRAIIREVCRARNPIGIILW